ncbi:hypothetical protein FACS1894200_12160 [Spirochaetia bacterium]|nr:hypothetical protein FACS1894200_12160 [Spirochaetia bacterium]
MTIEQTINIPDSDWLHLDLPLPQNHPLGRVRLEVTVIPETEDKTDPASRKMTPQEAVAYCRGFGKRLGSKLTSDLALEWRREDKTLEDAKFRRGTV